MRLPIWLKVLQEASILQTLYCEFHFAAEVLNLLNASCSFFQSFFWDVPVSPFMLPNLFPRKPDHPELRLSPSPGDRLQGSSLRRTWGAGWRCGNSDGMRGVLASGVLCREDVSGIRLLLDNCTNDFQVFVFFQIWNTQFRVFVGCLDICHFSRESNTGCTNCRRLPSDECWYYWNVVSLKWSLASFWLVRVIYTASPHSTKPLFA